MLADAGRVEGGLNAGGRTVIDGVIVYGMFESGWINFCACVLGDLI